MGLADATDTLGRWMCHHVSYLIATASKSTPGLSRERAQKEAVTTILSLWERRVALPGNAYPLARYKYLLRCLSATSPDASIWEGHGSSALDDLARSIFGNLTGIANTILAFNSRPPLFERKRQPVPAISILFLRSLEQKLLRAAETLDDHTLAILSGEVSPSKEPADPKRRSLTSLLKVIEATQANLASLTKEVNKELAGGAKRLSTSSPPVGPDGDILIVRDLSEAESMECIGVLREGGAVDIASAKRGLKVATKIAVAKKSGKIAGLAVLKASRPAYASRIATLSTSSIGKGSIELGYVAVSLDARGRGLGGDLLDALLDRVQGPLFATTSSNKMKKMLRDRGFQKTGTTWKGKAGRLSLWQRKQLV
jgi:predicted GNAT family N-acyltransferase